MSTAGRADESMLLCRIPTGQLLTAVCVCLRVCAWKKRYLLSLQTKAESQCFLWIHGVSRAPGQKKEVPQLDHWCPTPQIFCLSAILLPPCTDGYTSFRFTHRHTSTDRDRRCVYRCSAKSHRARGWVVAFISLVVLAERDGAAHDVTLLQPPNYLQGEMRLWLAGAPSNRHTEAASTGFIHTHFIWSCWNTEK